MTAKTTEGNGTVGKTETPFCPILDEEVGLKEFFRSTKRTSIVGIEVEETLNEMWVGAISNPIHDYNLKFSGNQKNVFSREKAVATATRAATNSGR